MPQHHIGVIGAGIVGLATARHLIEHLPGVSVTVLEKEAQVGAHQTSHNSGVVHAGIYYAPNSLKSKLIRRGVGLLREYCQDKSIAFEEAGKLVIASNASEVSTLDNIESRARTNQVPGLRRVSGAEIREIEPNAIGVAALHSPHTAITDYRAVTRALAADIQTAGGVIKLGATVTSIAPSNGLVRVTAGGEAHTFDRLIICAGLQADSVAQLAGDDASPAIVPFRGEYYRLVDERADLVRGLIYPVPDPSYPFLGVHFTRRIDGTVEIGPNAVLALAREGYTWGSVSSRELARTLAWPGFRALAKQHWRMGVDEMIGSASKSRYLRRAQAYVPGLRGSDVVRAGAGVRAQAVDRDGSLVDDFRVHRLGPILAVRNAPSPAATSSLAIAEYLVREMLTD